MRMIAQLPGYFRAATLALLLALPALARGETVIRVGHFPNITHLQALVAHHLSREGKGWFEERLGPGTRIEWYVYNAGPSATEAIFANSIDLSYIGPSPAINAYARSEGEEIRIVAGAAEGGAALVVQPEEGLKTGADFRGKKIATPQLGNTQDVSCRAWLANQGLRITQLGGDATVIPTANPDQLSLFQQKKIDAVWTVEPWVSRLEMEAGGRVLVEEKDAVATVLVARAKYLEEQRSLVKRFVAAHAELTKWIQEHPDEAQKMVREELTEETKREMPAALVAHSWPRIVLTAAVAKGSLEKFVGNAQKAGFLRGSPDLGRLFEEP